VRLDRKVLVGRRLLRMRTAALILVLVSSACAQLDPDTITVTAYGSQSTLAPDQLVFNLAVRANPVIGLDEIAGALSGAGISAKDLFTMYQPSSCVHPDGTLCAAEPVTWIFNFVTSVKKLPDVLGAIGIAQQAQPSLAISLQGYASAAPQPCAITTLTSDARSQAEKMATAAGFRVGPVVSVIDGAGGPTIGVPVSIYGGIGTPALAFGNALVSNILTSPQSPPCAATVQFKLLR
jgi:hypothetical protein